MYKKSVRKSYKKASYKKRYNSRYRRNSPYKYKSYKYTRMNPYRVRTAGRIIRKLRDRDPDDILYTIGYVAGVGILLSTALNAISFELLEIANDIFLD